jgi:adenylate cyclase
MSKRTRIQLNQLVIIAIAWMMAGVLISVYDYLVLAANETGASHNFLLSLSINVGSGLFGALIGGSYMVFYINVKYQDKPYGYTLLAVSVSFLLIVLCITFIRGMIVLPLRTGLPLSHPVTLDAFRDFLSDGTRAKNVLVWSMIVSITQLMMQFNGKFGQGTFSSTLRGKYNTPRQEKKIFMFLDLNSSTTIAEKLGDEKYHSLLKDFFADITNPILNSRGEIYQYVGDEVVVVWNYEDGLQDNQCIRCFFDIKQYIHDNRDRYLKRYGLVPNFKGGIHCGNVIAGEIGTIKREITYSGDVLNTTSRILSMCRQFGAEILSSTNLAAALQPGSNFFAEQLGAVKLKGKEKEVMVSALYSLSDCPDMAA